MSRQGRLVNWTTVERVVAACSYLESKELDTMTEKKLNQYLTDFPESQLNYYGLVIGNTYRTSFTDDEELDTIGKDLTCVFKEITLRRFELDEPWKLVSYIEEKSLTNAFEAFELLREYFSKDVVEEDEGKVVQ